MSSTVTTEAIRKTVLVDFTPAEAFELFTARIASWWPVGTHSYGGDAVKDVVLEPQVGGRLYEVTDDGQQDWGRVLGWDPPHRLRLDWQIGEACGTEVEVRFSPEGPGARVELEHRGFSRPAIHATALHRRLGRRPGAVRRDRQALDADVDRLPGRAVAQERGDQLGEPARREQLRGRRQLLLRPPAHGRDVLGRELLGREPRHGLEAVRPDEHVPLDLSVPLAVEERE